MTLNEAIISAVKNRNFPLLERITDALRVGHNGVWFDYKDTQQLFERCAGIDADEFEQLMYELDHYISQN